MSVDPEREREAREWIELVIGEELLVPDLERALKNGVALCKLANHLGYSIKYNESKLAFKQMENISLFTSSICSAPLSVPAADTFQTVDLYEAKNIPKVIDTIFAVSRCAQAAGVWNGPILGPALAKARSVSFTEEQLNAGKGVISLQYGYNGGASQKGIVFGGRREIGTTDAPMDTNTPNMLMGFRGANASGVSFGGRREIGGHDPGRTSNNDLSAGH